MLIYKFIDIEAHNKLFGEKIQTIEQHLYLTLLSVHISIWVHTSRYREISRRIVIKGLTMVIQG